MTAMANLEPATQTPAPSQGQSGLPTRTYLLVALSIAVLTLIGVATAYARGEPKGLLAAALLVLAAVGVALEVLYYMHLKVSPERRMFALFFGAGVGLATLMAAALAILLQYAAAAR